MESIIWITAANENEKAIEMLEQLSVFFRIALSKGGERISVREEVEHLYSYLYIQSVRYSDRLIFKIDVDEDIADCIMLKLTLQPIVENAIYHGIKNKKEGGEILIRGKMDERGDLMFVIRDSGMGMPQQKCNELNKSILQQSDEELERANGFGLYNVNRRIQLYCGERYGLKVESAEGIGTTVTVRMAADEGGGKKFV